MKQLSTIFVTYVVRNKQIKDKVSCDLHRGVVVPVDLVFFEKVAASYCMVARLCSISYCWGISCMSCLCCDQTQFRLLI